MVEVKESIGGDGMSWVEMGGDRWGAVNTLVT
jgi:hypothetical protein